MEQVAYKVIVDERDPALPAVQDLFTRMHHEMASQGMGLSLAEGGAGLWCASVSRGLERFNRLVIAMHGERVVGFAHGAVKLAPEHLGGMRLGHISHVHVAVDARGKGIGRGMVDLLHAWFADREVASIELHVLAGNDAGQAFWRSLGYRVELHQLRKG
ncbi:MAG: GNAT family N-acetyltransferase [Flavobacteriales bacterium]|nr:GNAT family N-acetyltransferase [Flavobacteriales bacterium]